MTVVGYSGQSQVSQYNNDIHTLLQIFLVTSLIVKEMHHNVTRSGFKPESLDHFGTETWNAGNMVLGILIYISEEFAKLRSAIINRVMSVFLIATTPIPLSGLTWNLMFEYFSEICGEKSRSFGIQRSCRVFYKRPKWVYRNISYIFFTFWWPCISVYLSQ